MMADVVKIATRDSYGNAVTALAAEHDDILVLDADLAGATKTAIFKKAYPDRHINCGIAEADLIGVSAGLSTMGFVPFCSSFAMFAAGRAYEQVRNTVGYPHLNQDLRHPRRYLRRRGRRFPPVLRRLRAHAHDPRHGRALPGGRCGSARRRQSGL